MEKITVGYDGNPAADSALRWVAQRTTSRPARVTIAGVDDAFHSTQRRSCSCPADGCRPKGLS